ncbi:MAG TPA: hypothetical protein VGC56_13395 [Allosphingosinicella sp.]|jgi:hypothetical protein
MQIAFLGMLLGISPLPQGTNQSWCQALPTRGHVLEERKDVTIEQIRTPELARAVRMLTQRSLVPLAPARYERLVGKRLPAGKARFTYLVRAGFMAGKHLSNRGLLEEGRKPWYTVYAEDRSGVINITSLLTAYDEDQVPTGFPLVLVAQRPIRGVTIRCIGGS